MASILPVTTSVVSAAAAPAERAEPVAAGWNQHGTAFGIGTESGFEIYNAGPARLNFARELRGGIGIVKVISRTNIVAIVGGGRSPAFPSTSLILWDDAKGAVAMEMPFGTPVLDVHLRYYRIVVVLAGFTYIYAHDKFDGIRLVGKIETAPNPNGLAGIIGPDDPERGSVVTLGPLPGEILLGDRRVVAHRSPLARMAIEAAGDMVATASETGTIIRVFARSGSLLREFRRGSTPGCIVALAFDAAHLVAVSGSGTGHIYSFTEQNRQSSLAVLGGYLGYFGSEWSGHQLRIDPGSAICFCCGSLRVVTCREYRGYMLLRGGISVEEHATL